MNKKIYFIIALIIMSISVSAIDVDVNCKNGWWDTDVCRDFELQDEFDDVTDAINENTNIINENTNEISETNNYILGKETNWAKDSKGWSKYNVIEYLENQYLTFLHNFFVTKQEYNALQDRTDLLEARINLGNDASYSDIKLESAKIKSLRTNKEVFIDGYKCNWKLCIKVN